MPELPEVETVRNSLKLRLIGKKICSVHVYYDGIIESPSVNEFQSMILGQTIWDINRYGKWLIFVLDDYYLLSHLRMEGKYFFKSSKDRVLKHEHVVFLFDDGTELRYMDVRKFGKMNLIKKEDIHSCGPLVGMGLEPWDKGLTSAYLKEKFRNRRLPVKSLLLDQSIIAGIGNIYADEILFLSCIHPLKKGCDLKDDELKKIIKFAREVFEKAIKKGGTTIRSYTSVNGVHGLFQFELYVHGRCHECCKVCGGVIEKIKVGGRGTYYCTCCQR